MYTQPTVRQERAGWRDENISRRHRIYGWDCPGVDLDFPMVEFNRGLPVALVEYKAIGAKMPNLTSPTYNAMRVLANNSGIPFLVVFYDSRTWWFRVIPANVRALYHLPKVTLFSEREYVTFLYKLRGLPLPAELNLNTFKPQGGQP
jgi:hypothetical protein